MKFIVKVINEKDEAIHLEEVGRKVSMKAFINSEKLTKNDKDHLRLFRIDTEKEYAHFITYDILSVAELLWSELSKPEIHERIIKSCIFFVWERKGYYFDNIEHFFSVATLFADKVLKMIEYYEKAQIDLKIMWYQMNEEEIEEERQKGKDLMEKLGITCVDDSIV
ncbi:hypothetical protein CN689_01055 [Peribacillus butanolivorans]|uniref:Uncharacterized protein n=1 Tax=Peribacillus butanolivorans TaxID=421767 RepID=A0AAX0RT59_9BACI|nr:hypothetical protein [Peribacillus butanolivorans]PEJ37518.1 hypothetical protein CN689_01055 [Peribacillus butanolivorans]